MGSRGADYDWIAGKGLVRPDPERDERCVRVDNHLHSDGDAICPRCLSWIEERDFVRQTAYGPLQHEVCPVARPA